MLITTNGIVLHSTKYSDTSLIVKIFTEKQGTQSFIVKGAFSKKGKIRASLFSTLALVSITYDDHNKSNLKFIKEISKYDLQAELCFDPVRSSILLFYNEILYKLLFDAGEDVVLFHFLEEEITKTADIEELTADLPLRFLIRLSIVLGFFPENNHSSQDCHFSLSDGRFQSFFIDERNDLPEAESLYLSQLMLGDTSTVANRSLRNSLLRYLIQYYIIHNEQIREIESVEILSAVLH